MRDRIIDLDGADDKPTRAERSYTVYCECENCGELEYIEIERGILITNAVCPFCDCMSLIRAAEPGSLEEFEDLEDDPLDTGVDFQTIVDSLELQKARESQEGMPHMPISPFDRSVAELARQVREEQRHGSRQDAG